MTKNDWPKFVDRLKDLASGYRVKLEKRTIERYWKDLQRVPMPIFLKAIANASRHFEKFPVPALLLGSCQTEMRAQGTEQIGITSEEKAGATQYGRQVVADIVKVISCSHSKVDDSGICVACHYVSPHHEAQGGADNDQREQQT